MTRYVVIGAGAVGSVIAAQLHGAGRDVVLVARGEALRVLRERGLTVRRPASAGERAIEVLNLPVADGPDDVDLRADDVLLLTTKAQDVEAALAQWSWRPVTGGVDAPEAWPGMTAADLPLVTFQNGIESERAALRRSSAVYGATTWIAASHTEPGVVVSPSWPLVGLVWVGRFPGGHDPRADALAADLTAAGFRAWSVPDITRWTAHKLQVNATNALDLFAADGEAEAAALREIGRALVAEATAVFAAAGIDVADPAEVGAGPGTLSIEEVPGHVRGRRSTWQSFARGAGSEVDHLNGDLVLLGRLHGVPTPVNERVQRLLAAAAREGRGTRPLAVGLLTTAQGTPETTQHITRQFTRAVEVPA